MEIPQTITLGAAEIRQKVSMAKTGANQQQRLQPEPAVSITPSNKTTREKTKGGEGDGVELAAAGWGGARACAEHPLCQGIKHGAWQGGAVD